MKNILILGGTKFMGRLLTEQLLKHSNYKITLFNRGKSAPTLFSELELIKGDRQTNDIFQLTKKDWDVVIDFSCYHPNSLNRILEALKGKVNRYIFISTISVFDFDQTEMPLLETSQKVAYTNELLNQTTVTAENYGPKKIRCEEILQEADWLDSILFRPSFVYGQYDFTERFYYWLYRVKTQERFLIPDEGKELMNLSFVDDLVEFVEESIEISQHRFDYNIPTHAPNSLKEKLEIMAEVLGTNPEYHSKPFAEITTLLKPLKTRLPCFRGKDTVQISNTKLLADFKTVPQSFKASIERMAAYHDKLGWKEGIAGLRVADELKMLS